MKESGLQKQTEGKQMDTKDGTTGVITLTFFKKWHETAEQFGLTDIQYGAVIRAMCNYCFFSKDTNLESPEGFIFEMSKPHIDKSNKNKLGGSKGGEKARGKSGARIGNTNASKKKG